MILVSNRGSEYRHIRNTAVREPGQPLEGEAGRVHGFIFNVGTARDDGEHGRGAWPWRVGTLLLRQEREVGKMR